MVLDLPNKGPLVHHKALITCVQHVRALRHKELHILRTHNRGQLIKCDLSGSERGVICSILTENLSLQTQAYIEIEFYKAYRSYHSSNPEEGFLIHEKASYSEEFDATSQQAQSFSSSIKSPNYLANRLQGGLWSLCISRT